MRFGFVTEAKEMKEKKRLSAGRLAWTPSWENEMALVWRHYPKFSDDQTVQCRMVFNPVYHGQPYFHEGYQSTFARDCDLDDSGREDNIRTDKE